MTKLGSGQVNMLDFYDFIPEHKRFQTLFHSFQRLNDRHKEFGALEVDRMPPLQCAFALWPIRPSKILHSK